MFKFRKNNKYMKRSISILLVVGAMFSSNVAFAQWGDVWPSAPQPDTPDYWPAYWSNFDWSNVASWAPPNPLNPVVDELYVRGGYHSVNTVNDRNLIPILLRRKGMLVYVGANSSTYRLRNFSRSDLSVINFSNPDAFVINDTDND